MEWLIDIIKEWLQLYLQGMIVMWHGLLADIPDGWTLCDGNNGTPNLTNKFIFSVSGQEGMNQVGGNSTHTHNFTSNTHKHNTAPEVTADNVTEGAALVGTLQGNPETNLVAVTGTTDSESNIPPYYTLAYIMKL